MKNASQERLLRYIKGYINVELKGDYVERLLNMCKAHKVSIWNINSISNNNYTCCIEASELKNIQPLVRKTNTKIRVKRKRGFPFKVIYLKRKMIYFIGFSLCLIFLNLVTNYVWAVEFIGNYNITNDELYDFLEEENIYYGIKKKVINCEEEEKRLREKFQGITWASIYYSGTKLLVEIKENEIKNSESHDNKSNIIADISGTLYSIITRNGIPKVKIGDTIEEGQLLVEGKVPIYDESQSIINYHMYRSDADIYVQTNLPYKENIKKIHPVLRYTGKEKKKYFIKIPNLYIETPNIGKFAMSEAVMDKRQLKILGNIYLPLYYGNIVSKEYYIDYIEYTNDELECILNRNFDEFILCLQEKGVQILEKNVKISKYKNSMELVSDIVAICKCGVNEPIIDTNSEE